VVDQTYLTTFAKAGEERAFYTVETNFFPGRKFTSLEDLNAQALHWSTVRIYNRELTKAKIIPAVAFEFERAYLNEIPPFIPAPYQVLTRSTNQYGYIPFDGNFYWVPGDTRFEVRVLQYSASLKLYRGRTFLIDYPLPADGVKNKEFIPEGAPRPRHRRSRNRKPSAQEEARLREMGDVVCQYLDFALKPKGIERHRMVRELFALSRTMTPSLFVQSVARALKYKITTLQTIERIALLYLNEGAASVVPDAEVDDSYREREAYREGLLTDIPDLSAYDRLLEEDHG
jgi:hypothetical protein